VSSGATISRVDSAPRADAARLQQALARCEGLLAENVVLARALAGAQQRVTACVTAQARCIGHQERCIVRLRAALVCQLSLRAWAVPCAPDPSNPGDPDDRR
jgi:hypothetical protein